LNLIPGTVQRLPELYQGKKLRVPNVGWLKIYSDSGKLSISEFNAINQNDYMYFVHSFYAKPLDPNVIVAQSEYDGFSFCSAVKKDNIFGVQFHPEKSGKKGLLIYQNIKNILEKRF